MSVAQCYRVLQSFTECYRVLQSITEYKRVLQSVTECYRVLECYSVLQNITVLQSIAKYYKDKSSASTWTNFWACYIYGSISVLLTRLFGLFRYFW